MTNNLVHSSRDSWVPVVFDWFTKVNWRRFYLLLILAIMVTQEALGKEETRKVVWAAGCSAPSEFPVRLLTGQFICIENKSVRLPISVFIGGQWGWSSSHHAPESAFPLPDSLRVTWFSFRERKFYSLDTDLNSLPIKAIFSAGYIDPIEQKRKDFDEIRVGLAPAGYIVLWASGNGLSIEIGMLRANRVLYDTALLTGPNATIEDFVTRNDDGGRRDLSVVRENDHRIRKWSETFRRSYAIRLNVATTVPVTGLLLEYFGGSATQFQTKSSWEASREMGVPRSTIISWTSPAQLLIHSRIDFDETETFAAFEHLHHIDTAKPLTIHFELNKVDYSIRAFLGNGKKMIPLDKIKTKAWRGAD